MAEKPDYISRNVALCTVLLWHDHVTTRFPDGAQSDHWPPVTDPTYIQTARLFGYTNPLQYGLEHDLTHNWLAEFRGHDWSEVIRAAAVGKRDPDKQQVYDDEEHLVNRLQYYINTGRLDDDYGVLGAMFGSDLPFIAMRLWRFLRGGPIVAGDPVLPPEEYEAFEAALRMTERETTATMLRVAKSYEAEAHKQSHEVAAEEMALKEEKKS